MNKMYVYKYIIFIFTVYMIIVSTSGIQNSKIRLEHQFIN